MWECGEKKLMLGTSPRQHRIEKTNNVTIGQHYSRGTVDIRKRASRTENNGEERTMMLPAVEREREGGELIREISQQHYNNNTLCPGPCNLCGRPPQYAPVPLQVDL